MDNQVVLWMQRKSEDSDTEVPSSVLKYFFQRGLLEERLINTFKNFYFLIRCLNTPV